MQTFPTHVKGTKILDLDGKVQTYQSSIPKVGVFDLMNLQAVVSLADRQMSKVSTEDPMAAKEAAGWDRLNVEAWKSKWVKTARVRGMIDAAVRVIFGAEPAEVSLLYFLSYLRGGGGIMRLSEAEGGAQQDRFVDGAQGLSKGLAAILGDRVQLSSPALRVEQDQDGVIVEHHAGTCRARRVIIALPPATVRELRFDPTLPVRRAQLLQRYAMGATIKVLGLYESAFWRDAGFSGEVVSNTPPFSVVYDNTSHDGSVPALLGFVVGDQARLWANLALADRRSQAKEAWARYFGDAARRPVEYLEQDWQKERWSGGCPISFLPPGALRTGAAMLRAPCGRVHWAGSETATEWAGFLEGALQAGERAAEEVLRELG